MRRETYAVAASRYRSGEWRDGVTYALLADEWKRAMSPGRPGRTMDSPGGRRSMSLIRGTLTTETFDYDGRRHVTVYRPPGQVDSVVMAADGGWHTTALAESVEQTADRTTMIVGVSGRMDGPGRLAEYVPSVDTDRFDTHERFFLSDVRAWVESRFGVHTVRERTAVWGASLGGEFALAMGLRHPDVFGAVMSASPGTGFKPPSELPHPVPRVYLVAGREEPFFLRNARRWATALGKAGADVVMTERDGGHGGAFWIEEFPLMVDWAFAS